MLKYATANTVCAIFVCIAVYALWWLVAHFVWLLIPFGLIGIFILYCAEYKDDKVNENEDNG